LEVPEQELDEVSRLLKSHMEAAMSLRVPLVVHLSHSQNLGKEDT
jgi:DNA polymerase I-like protein with 3'-5' exonuclease and polymerase domains